MYNVVLRPAAEKFICDLPPSDAGVVLLALRNLERDPRPPGCLKLTADEGYRLRVGRYRVLYEVNDKKRVVTIYRIKHRKDVYR